MDDARTKDHQTKVWRTAMKRATRKLAKGFHIAIGRRRSRAAVQLFAALTIAFAEIARAQTDASTSPATEQTRPAAAQVQGEGDASSAIAEEIVRAKQRNAAEASAYERYDQDVERANGERKVALEKCASLVNTARKSCEQRADADFDAAKSKANETLKSHLSSQP